MNAFRVIKKIGDVVSMNLEMGDAFIFIYLS